MQDGDLEDSEQLGLRLVTGQAEVAVVRGDPRDEAEDADDEEHDTDGESCLLHRRPGRTGRRRAGSGMAGHGSSCAMNGWSSMRVPTGSPLHTCTDATVLPPLRGYQGGVPERHRRCRQEEHRMARAHARHRKSRSPGATREGGAPRRVVVTGGAGFLGSHLCTALVDQGAEVLALDNFVTGSPGQRGAPPPRPRLPARALRRHRLRPRPRTGRPRAPLRLTGLARSTTCGCRSRPSRSARSAPGTPWAWPRTRAPASCSPRPRRSTATRSATRSRRATGATSTPSARGASTTRASASARR